MGYGGAMLEIVSRIREFTCSCFNRAAIPTRLFQTCPNPMAGLKSRAGSATASFSTEWLGLLGVRTRRLNIGVPVSGLASSAVCDGPESPKDFRTGLGFILQS